MPYFPEQFTSVIKANAEVQYAITADLNDRLIKHFEELSKLNLDAAKATLAESSANMKEFFRADNPQDFFVLNAEHIKRDIQNVVFYESEATRIVSAVQIELNKAAGAKIAEASHNGTTLLTELSKNVPVSTEQFFAMLKSSMSALDAANEPAKKKHDGTAAHDQSPGAVRHAPSKRNGHQTAGAPH